MNHGSFHEFTNIGGLASSSRMFGRWWAAGSIHSSPESKQMKRILACTIGAAFVVATACSNSGDLTQPGRDLQLTASDTAEAAAISAGDATAEDVDIFAATEGSLELAGAN